MNQKLAVLILLTFSCAAPQKPTTTQTDEDDLAPAEGSAVKDEKSAEEICASGAGDMCAALADHHFRRAKTDEQRSKALTYAKKACDLKDGAGCSLAGWAQEWGVKPDLSEALKSYEAGCAINDGRSCAKAATILSFGPPSKRDREKARTYATKSCAAKDEEGCTLEQKLKAEPKLAATNDCGKPPGEPLTKKQLGDVIKWHSTEIKDCFDRALHQTPTLAGRVEVAWTIECSGAVAKPTIAESTLPKDVNACVLENVKAWKFPALKGGGTATVNFPWVLKPSAKK